MTTKKDKVSLTSVRKSDTKQLYYTLVLKSRRFEDNG